MTAGQRVLLLEVIYSFGSVNGSSDHHMRPRKFDNPSDICRIGPIIHRVECR